MPTHAKPKKRKRRTWVEISNEAQEHRRASIDRVRPSLPDRPWPALSSKNAMNIPEIFLDPFETSITQMLPEELVAMLAKGDVTAKAATNAFLRRAALAQRVTNCITELLPERALTRAESLDEFYTQHKRPIGPLHGLPISVKEHLGMKGLRLSAGYCAWWDNVASDDAHVLKILWDAGAVFYARTTEPQSMMHLETHSNLYGVTVCPYNTDLSAGGSSGGEGALIAMRGSCLGIGTDVGGGIRNPAANNGIYGFKPTGFRIPTDGWSSIAAGADCVISCIGPLSTSLAGLSLFMRVVISAKPWLTEPALIPMPWNQEVAIKSTTRLKIGIMMHDNIVLPHPPITRALSTLSEKLFSTPNITVVPWQPHLHDEAWAILSSLYYPDGGAADLEVMAESGEPLLPLTDWILNENPCVKTLSLQQLSYWVEEREEYRSEYAAVWNKTGATKTTGDAVDDTVHAILCPVGPSVANRLNTAKYWGYTAVWNLLDYPAVSFPVDKVDRELDRAYPREEFMSGADEQNWKLYNDHPEEFHGVPVSLQLVGRRFEDEKVLAVLEYLHAVAKLPLCQFP
ncbi:uncharacterized protein A1O9_05850 [Exophiala aquamarina CBS 119918]|uniref:Amidase domain-containing protein n=1 Tax=Exophiala aquamarina CBS 119918 TaxID=1182545 RepID=A0A072PF87_9EURO|nr:uncharacterized protein A1O9_05850 [Exophiala aquamarina CBS 119918]KEF57928.1 hypothetical protein A1O9_05850 [Exophiala aquamarina CBS 119918]